jgi:hypothetical protein
MTTEIQASKPEPAAPTQGKIDALTDEIATYRRELPRLLEEGQEGRFILLLGSQILSLWDTCGDALQAGYERFGPDGRFVVKLIDPRDRERFSQLDAEGKLPCPS